MSKLRLQIIVIACLLTLTSSTVVAQLEKLDYKPGDKIEVEFGNEWFEAEVQEILPGGVALKADFVDSRGRQRSFIFVSQQVRDIKKAKEPSPPPESKQDEVLPTGPVESRTWNSADGNFSVEARLVIKLGDKVQLLKADGLTITVGLSVLSPADIKYVEDLTQPNSPPDNEDPFAEPDDEGNGEITAPMNNPDPFAEPDEESPFKESNDKPGDNNDSVSDEGPFAAFGNRSAPADSKPSEARPDRNTESKKPAASNDRTDLPGVNSKPITPKKSADSPTNSAPLKTANDEPNAVVPVQTNLRAAWRWITFGTLFSTGCAMFIWGFVNRNRYW